MPSPLRRRKTVDEASPASGAVRAAEPRTSVAHPPVQGSFGSRAVRFDQSALRRGPRGTRPGSECRFRLERRMGGTTDRPSVRPGIFHAPHAVVGTAPRSNAANDSTNFRADSAVAGSGMGSRSESPPDLASFSTDGPPLAAKRRPSP